jgi:hypothetical protein
MDFKTMDSVGFSNWCSVRGGGEKGNIKSQIVKGCQG